jgi:hypothetical protein
MKKPVVSEETTGFMEDPGRTYFRAVKHYHWSCELNVRVRNGNACFLAGNLPGNRRSDSGAAASCVMKSKSSQHLTVNQSGQAFLR